MPSLSTRMRKFLSFILKGRLRMMLAIFVMLALPLPLFWLVGISLVGLACLRLGLRTSTTILVGVGLPIVVLAFLQGAQALLGILLVSLWVMSLAAILREYAAWNRVLLINVAYIFMATFLLYFFTGDMLQVVQEELLARMEESTREALPVLSKFALALSFAYSIGILAVLCLMLARYWQALLYKPGGFREEFHSLRMTPLTATFLGVLGVTLVLLGAPGLVGQERWVWVSLIGQILLLPSFFASLGLAHGLAGKRPGGGIFLVPFYLLLLLVREGRLLAVVLAVADSWLDFRGRYPYLPPSTSGQADGDESNTKEE